MKPIKWAMMAIVSVSSLVACNRDKNEIQEEVNKPYVLTMAYAPASGFNFSYYTVPFVDIMSGELDARGKGTEQVGYFDYTKIGNTIYAIGGLNDVKVAAIQQQPDNSLVEVASAVFPKSISDLVEADATNLLAVSVDRETNVINFYQMAKNTVSVAKTVSKPVSDITNISGVTGVGLEFTGLAVVGDKVFLSYYYINPSTFATPYVDRAEVAVYSYPDFTFQKVITDDRVGPIGGFNVKGGLIKDENGNVYAISTTNPANGYSQYTKPMGVLKISNGTSDFDSSYFWQMTDGEVVTHAKYLSAGNAFAKVNITPRGSQATWSDSVLKAAIVNFNSKKITYFNGVPEHKGQARRLAVLIDGENAFFPIEETNGTYIYKANLGTLESTRGAKVASSFVAGIFKY